MTAKNGKRWCKRVFQGDFSPVGPIKAVITKTAMEDWKEDRVGALFCLIGAEKITIFCGVGLEMEVYFLQKGGRKR